MWMIGAMVCLLAAPWVQLSVSAGNGWPHNALRHHWLMPISCHLRDCKVLLVTSLTHVSGAIASVQTFTLTITVYLGQLQTGSFTAPRQKLKTLVVTLISTVIGFLHRKPIMHCTQSVHLSVRRIRHPRRM